MTRSGEKATFHFQSNLGLVHTSDAKTSDPMDRLSPQRSVVWRLLSELDPDPEANTAWQHWL